MRSHGVWRATLAPVASLDSRTARRVAHVTALCVGVLLLVVGTIAGVVNREILDADRFAAHVDTVRTDPDVARQLGVEITDRLLEEQPDLVAIRPLLETTATSVVASPSISPLVRSAVAPLYRAIVLGQGDAPLVLRLADVAAVVVGVITEVSPRADATIPANLDVQLSELGGQEYDAGVVDVVHRVVCGVGGTRGWYAGDWLWSVRGLLDTLVGGPGVRRGRRDADDLRVGDALDFWRVEALEPERLLRLRAEMRLPGEASLEWRLAPGAAPGTTAVTQVATFVPRGLWGRAYWYAVAPFHGFVFPGLLAGLAADAERRAPRVAA